MSRNAELFNYLSGKDIEVKMVTAMVKAGADPNTVNVDGDTLLHIIIYSKAFHLIPSVLSLGIHVEKPNNSGLTPLQCLFNLTPINMEAAALLIKAGASIDTTDSKGNNLAHQAVLSNNLTNICFAIRLGVNLESPNDLGHTPLFCLLSQRPVNADAAALLVLAATGILNKKLQSIMSLIKHDPIIHRYQQSFSSRDYLDPLALVSLAKKDFVKERILRHIKSLSPGLQLKLVYQALNEETPLGKIFYTQRGLLKPHPGSGTLASLTCMKQQLSAQYPPNTVNVIQSASNDVPTPTASPYAPSAPTSESCSSSINVFNPSYPGMMFSDYTAPPPYAPEANDSKAGYFSSTSTTI